MPSAITDTTDGSPEDVCFENYCEVGSVYVASLRYCEGKYNS